MVPCLWQIANISSRSVTTNYIMFGLVYFNFSLTKEASLMCDAVCKQNTGPRPIKTSTYMDQFLVSICANYF